MILQNEVEGPDVLPEVDLLSIHEAGVSGLICIDDIYLRVGVLGESGHFVAHKPPGEGTGLI